MIDTHAHLFDEKLEDNTALIIGEAKDAGIDKIINPSMDITTSNKSLQIANDFPEIVFPAIGIHPTEVIFNKKLQSKEAVDKELEKLTDLLQNNRESVVAIGEVGLDYYWIGNERAILLKLAKNKDSNVSQDMETNHSRKLSNQDSTNSENKSQTKEQSQTETIKSLQQYLLVKQMTLAYSQDLPVIIHLRDKDKSTEVYDDFLSVLSMFESNSDTNPKLDNKPLGKRVAESKQEKPKHNNHVTNEKNNHIHCNIKIQLHSYSAPLPYLKVFLKYPNLYFSFTAHFTRKRAGILRDIIRKIPANRILLETDSPYVTISSPKLTKPNQPSSLPNSKKTSGVNTPAILPEIARGLADLRQEKPSELISTTIANTHELYKIY